MSDRPIGLGKVAENGTLNENGAFYSVQDINVLLEEKGSGGDLPTPTVADAGKAVVVDEEGKYTLGEAGGGNILSVTITGSQALGMTLNKSYKEITNVLSSGGTVIFTRSSTEGVDYWYLSGTSYVKEEEMPYGVVLFSGSMGQIYEYSFLGDSENGTLTYTPGS